ncbi:class I SAM-dependent methyltransferase [Marinomonas sp. C2222]|uniref:Class I SAM-dependent methyltransferase n=1 Tax=Marinomonas sargassi TaxID=2984494 RepID=A0ABT2YTP6_9GAMM|nr:class I SAM-dependent methyltransferase [Marinomonas sargassi]MCV2403251.1 class I SAM-dependent methyltransferase [Marinomonas sargassi]
MAKAFSPSCDRNQQPILDQLSVYFKQAQQVLEIGSGTGQHAVFFAKYLSHVTWRTSDMLENHGSIQAWIDEANLTNLIAPFEFHFGKHAWPDLAVDAVFTANTTHIMQREDAKLMMETVAENLPKGGVFCQYGPMNVDGEYTSEGNRDFDQSLQQGGYGGIRDIAELVEWAVGMTLVEKVDMPANNFLLVWKRE